VGQEPVPTRAFPDHRDSVHKVGGGGRWRQDAFAHGTRMEHGGGQVVLVKAPPMVGGMSTLSDSVTLRLPTNGAHNRLQSGHLARTIAHRVAPHLFANAALQLSERANVGESPLPIPAQFGVLIGEWRMGWVHELKHALGVVGKVHESGEVLAPVGDGMDAQVGQTREQRRVIPRVKRRVPNDKPCATPDPEIHEQTPNLRVANVAQKYGLWPIPRHACQVKRGRKAPILSHDHAHKNVRSGVFGALSNSTKKVSLTHVHVSSLIVPYESLTSFRDLNYFLAPPRDLARPALFDPFL
jgi:hypothetical protein